MKTRPFYIPWLVLTICEAAVVAAPAMDYGPFLSYSILKPDSNQTMADKGIAIRVGNDATVCFDTAALRMAAGWTGGFLDLAKTNLGGLKGSSPARIAGQLHFSTDVGPGWAKGGSLADPRKSKYGPLPRDWAHYKGLYRHGDRVVLSYTVGNADVLDMPGSFLSGRQVVFTRTIRVGKSATPLKLHVLDAKGELADSAPGVAITDAAGTTLVAAYRAGAPLTLKASQQAGVVSVDLEISPVTAPALLQVILSRGPRGQGLAQLMAAAPQDATGKLEDPLSLRNGGPPLWNPPIVVRGVTAPPSAAPYVVETLTLADDNPWHSWMRPSGFDFFCDGRCALCTMNGDVWIVSGIDRNLGQLIWKRFATGLYEPLGLKIVDNTIYVLGRDQITRLHDLAGSGEADFYENFNNDCITVPIYHAFNLDLQTDSKGNFYYVVDGNAIATNVPLHGCILKVSRDGSKTEQIASGLRAANGTGMGPHDELVCSDNQGHWTPVCRINWVKAGGFYGFNYDPRVATKLDIAHERKTYDPPLCWIPYEQDNSTGGQAFVTDPRWGPLAGTMVSTSYGKCRLFEVIWEKSDGIMQGASIPLPLQFVSGIMRARFNPADGQLYVCGLKGWQTSATRDGCLQRVRYTGKPFCLPNRIHVKADGIELGFTSPLNRDSAADEQNYSVQQWNYRWSSRYGSDKYRPSQSGKVGVDDVEAKKAELLPDGRSVFLSLPHLRPVMQLAVTVHIDAADGSPIECEIDCTINHVPGSSAPPVLTAP